MAKERDSLIRIIGAFKLVKALLLTAVSVTALSLIHGDPASHVASWMSALGFDPENLYVNEGLQKIEHADPQKLKEVGIGSLVYAALFMTEGVGLLLRRVWAEYLTVIITMSFIPFEIYEMIEHESWRKGALIAINVAIAVYLVLRLRRDKHWPFNR
ncbi:MAG: putative rane protein [Myxococcales bacterium]|nr:putative rane protein [Myxococcales bacterium]